MTPDTPSIDRLTREILHYEDLAISHAENAVKFKAEIGLRLNVAKGLIPHGQFIPWAEKAFGWSGRHVQRHMELGRNATRLSCLPAGASLRMALSAIAATTADPAAPRPIHYLWTDERIVEALISLQWSAPILFDLCQRIRDRRE